jgi:hypothetical protein
MLQTNYSYLLFITSDARNTPAHSHRVDFHLPTPPHNVTLSGRISRPTGCPIRRPVAGLLGTIAGHPPAPGERLGPHRAREISTLRLRTPGNSGFDLEVAAWAGAHPPLRRQGGSLVPSCVLEGQKSGWRPQPGDDLREIK